MSLDTVLKIGKALRESDDNLKHFKYVSPCPTDKDGNYPFCISIPITEDFTFDWNSIKEVQENERKKLYYLRFKTSDSDGLMKYIFGDIYYSKSSTIKKNGSIETKEGGGYRLENPFNKSPYDKSSFERGISDFEDIVKNTDRENSVLVRFRNNLQKDISILEKILGNISAVEYFLSNKKDIDLIDFLENESLLKDFSTKGIFDKTSPATRKKLGISTKDEQTTATLFSDSENELSKKKKEKLLQFDYGEIFIHFIFPQPKRWYDYKEEFNLITQKMLSDFVEDSDEGLVLKKTLYKTLCSGDKKNDIQFPNFDSNAKYKSKSFSDDEMQDLFYAIDFSKKGRLIHGTDIKIIILPKGENLTEYDYMNFQKTPNEVKIKEISNSDSSDFDDPIFSFTNEQDNNIINFDVIFSKKGGTTSPDVDLIEISGLEKSKIKDTKKRIRDISIDMYQKRKKYFIYTDKDFSKFKITSSFRNILGNPQSDMKTNKVSFKANSKYQSHLLKVAPLIYTDNYYTDDQLIPSFLQNVEYSIRAGDPRYVFLKFDLEFLITIQNNQTNKFMDIIQSESYQVGSLLGSLAKNFAGKDSPIKSFEKNYVGNLTRRISRLEELIKLKNDIEQKLIMHDKTKYTKTRQTSFDLAQKVKNFQSIYDKEECAFGFLESYFEPITKKEMAEEETTDQE